MKKTFLQYGYTPATFSVLIVTRKRCRDSKHVIGPRPVGMHLMKSRESDRGLARRICGKTREV